MPGRTRTTGARLAVVMLAIVVLAGCDWSQLNGFGPAGTNFNPSEPALTAASVAHLNAGWSKALHVLVEPAADRRWHGVRHRWVHR